MTGLDDRERALVRLAGSLARADADHVNEGVSQALAHLAPWEIADIAPAIGVDGQVVQEALHHAPSLPVGTREIAELEDHTTPVVEFGAGVPLVVIHSAGLDWRLVWGLAATLQSEVRLISYDLRAHGANTAPAASFDLDACATDLIVLLESLELRRAHVAGFSLGGAIAQLAALRHQERVESLVLACTMSAAKSDLYLARAKSVERAGSTAPELIPTLRRWFSDDALCLDPWYVHYARQRIRDTTVERWSQLWRAFAAFDIRDQVRDIRCPTTLIAGELDRSTTAEEMRQHADAIPGAAYHVIPGGPHMTVLEQPAAIARLVRGHLSAVTRKVA